jgi:hypothetical protein
MGKKCFNYFSQALAQKNITKKLRKISRTHMKNSRIFVNKFGQAGVYIARRSVEHARNRGCKQQQAWQLGLRTGQGETMGLPMGEPVHWPI